MVIFHSYVKLPEGMVSDTPEMLYDSATRRLFRTYHIFPAPEERRTHLLRHGFGRWFGSHLGNTARVLLVQVTKLFFRSVGERTTSNLYVERYDHWHKFFLCMYIIDYHCISLYYSMNSLLPQVPKSKDPQPFGHFRLDHGLAQVWPLNLTASATV